MDSQRNIAPSHRPSYREKYSIIIPAAGAGRRMRTYGPKSLIEIHNQSILQKQLVEIQKAFKIFEVVLVGGFEFDKLAKEAPNGICLVENKDYQETNVLHSIKLGLDRVTTDKVLVIYGDLIFNNECLALPFHKESGLVLTNTMKKEEVGCILENNRIANLFYQLESKWAQISYFTGLELTMLKDIANEGFSSSWFGFEAINKIIDNGGNFKAFAPKNAKAIDIDCSADLKTYEHSHKAF